MDLFNHGRGGAHAGAGEDGAGDVGRICILSTDMLFVYKLNRIISRFDYR